MEILRKFLPIFESVCGQWAFITLSSQRPHFCGDGRFVDNLEIIWDAYRYGFEMMVDSQEFEAVILLEEFQGLSFWPVPKVVAHVHAVVLCDEVSVRRTERLKQFVAEYPGWVKVSERWINDSELWRRLSVRVVDRKRRWVKLHECNGVPFELTGRTYRIETQTDFASILGYLVKPIDWSENYVEEWERYCAANRETANFFNQNVDQVIKCWQFFSSGRYQHVYLGTAHHARTGFIGIPKKRRETNRHKQRTLAILEDCNWDRKFSAPGNMGEPLELSADNCGGPRPEQIAADGNLVG
jgi:hypothetical protein